MKKAKLFIGAIVLFAMQNAFAAQDKPARASEASQTPAMDLQKMGSASRKPKDEKAVKKEVEAFLKQSEELEKKRDIDASVANISFPVYMVTDDSKGVVHEKEFSRDEYSVTIQRSE